MTQTENVDLKAKTHDIRGKLTDNSIALQEIIDNPGDLSSQVGARIGVSNSIKELIDAMDEYIDEQTE